MRVAMDVPQLRELLGRFVDVYYAQRFGPVRVAQGDAVELDETLDTLQVAWKASKMNT